MSLQPYPSSRQPQVDLQEQFFGPDNRPYSKKFQAPEPKTLARPVVAAAPATDEPALVSRGEALGLSISGRMANIGRYATYDTNNDGEIALRDLAEIDADIETVRRHIVLQLRARGRSWAEIGTALGVSGAAAHKKFSPWDTAVVAGGNNLTRTKGVGRKPSTR